MTLGGELDASHSDLVADAMAAVIERHPGNIVLDISGLELLDEVSRTSFVALCGSAGRSDWTRDPTTFETVGRPSLGWISAFRTVMRWARFRDTERGANGQRTRFRDRILA